MKPYNKFSVFLSVVNNDENKNEKEMQSIVNTYRIVHLKTSEEISFSYCKSYDRYFNDFIFNDPYFQEYHLLVIEEDIVSF